MRSSMLGESKARETEDVDTVALRNRRPLPNVQTMIGAARRTDPRRAQHPEVSEVVHSNRRYAESSF
jgi:hypothetical protein